MEWAQDTITRLRKLWDEGLSTAEIGRRLGISKNAVVGKAHRLDLPERPSPIRRDGAGGGTPRRSTPRRVSGPTLPPLSSTVTPVTASSAPNVPPPPPPAPDPEPPHSPPVIARLESGRRQPRRRHDGTGCCFPIGEPGTRSFRYCDDDLDITGEYCPEHHKLTVRQIRRPSLVDKLAA